MIAPLHWNNCDVIVSGGFKTRWHWAAPILLG